MSAQVQTAQYFAALERLKARGEKINNATVALEAGKDRSSIKATRPAHQKLVAAIEAAALEQAEKKQAKGGADPIAGLQAQVKLLTDRLDQSLEREIALLDEVLELRATKKALEEDTRQLQLGRLVQVR